MEGFHSKIYIAIFVDQVEMVCHLMMITAPMLTLTFLSYWSDQI